MGCVRAATDNDFCISDTDRPASEMTPRAEIASCVLFVGDVSRSTQFYRDFFGWIVTVHDTDATLLASPSGFQLFLISAGHHARYS